MSDRKPRLRQDLRWESLNLSAEEGFLLSRIDGQTSIEGLTHLTGQSSGQVEATLQKLKLAGALEHVPSAPAVAPRHTDIDTAVPKTVLHELELTLDEERSEPGPAAGAIDGAIDSDDEALIRAALADMSLEGGALGDDTDEGDPVLDDDSDDGPTIRMKAPPRPADGPDAVRDDDDFDGDANAAADDFQDDGTDAGDDKAAREGERQSDGSDDDAENAEGAAEDADEEDPAAVEGNYRKLYETQLHGLPLEEREKLARTAKGAEAMALCFDPVPQVILGLMENSEVGFPHARLIARHHRTPQGVEHLFRRNEFVRDGQVQRYLLANPMLSDSQLKKLLMSKRLAIIYKWALSRDLPEKNRNRVRHVLRAKWSRAEGDERAALIFQTEGRVLVMLTGLPFDSKTTTLLCQRTYNSVMLVQCLCRFASTPPLVLGHLAKQMIVKRQPHLRTMLSQHPNCPSDMKRKLRGG